MRQYTSIEELNVEYLSSKGFHFVVVNFTGNILDHGIFDATKNVRQFLKEQNIHDYDKQKSGENFFVSAHLLSFKTEYSCKASLYRSFKRGDKRMWFGRNTYSIVEENEACAIFCLNKELYVVNISSLDIELCYNSIVSNPIKEVMKIYINNKNNNVN